MPGPPFRVGFSADFLDEDRRLAFPDIGLSLLDAERAVALSGQVSAAVKAQTPPSARVLAARTGAPGLERLSYRVSS